MKPERRQISAEYSYASPEEVMEYPGGVTQYVEHEILHIPDHQEIDYSVPESVSDVEIPQAIPTEYIGGLISTFETFTPKAILGTNGVIEGPYGSAIQEGFEFPIASRIMEKYSGLKLLPTLNDIINEPNRESSYMPDMETSLSDRIADLANSDPITAHSLTSAWRQPLDSVAGSIYNHIPESLPSDVRESMQKKGRGILEEDSIEITEKDQKRYRKEPERAYAQAIWEQVTEVAGLEDLLVNPITGISRKTGAWNQDSQHTLLHTRINAVPELGGDTQEEITRESVDDLAESLYSQYSGESGEELLEGKTLSRLYKELTGDNLVDYQFNAELAEFFMAYYGGDRMNPASREYHDTMIQAFEAYAGTTETPVLKQLNERLSLLSPSAHVNVKPSEVDGLGQLNAEEVVQQSLIDLGIADKGGMVVADYLFNTGSEMVNWLSYAKSVGARLSSDDYKEMLALKVFTDVTLWKEGVKKQGWIDKNRESEKGTLVQVHEHFKQNPTEWMVRKYSDLTPSWSPMQIDIPKYGQAGHSKEDLSVWKKKDLYYSAGRRLLDEGRVPGSTPTLEHFMAHDLFPVYKIMLHVGATPTEVKAYFDDEMTKLPESMPRVQKARIISKELQTTLREEPFKLRFQEQYNRDVEARQQIINNIEQHGPIEREPEALTQRILVSTCGDSRTEAGRVGMKNYAPDLIKTAGAAGHFGIPYDQIIDIPRYPTDEQFAPTEFWTNMIDDETVGWEDVSKRLKSLKKEERGLKNQLAAFAKTEGFFWTQLKEFAEKPGGILPVMSYRYGELATGLLGVDLGSRILTPRLRKKMMKRIEEEARHTWDVDITPTAYLSEEEAAKLDVNVWKKAGSPQEYAQFRAETEIKKIEFMADKVQAELEATGLDPNTWLPGEKKMLVKDGHMKDINSNDVYAAYYDCGACGGHGGEKNAQLIAKWMNDERVRDVLRGREINLDDIFVLPAVYNTTVSETTILTKDIPAEYQELVETFSQAAKAGDTEALLAHESLMTHKPIEKLDPEKVRIKAEKRSANWNTIFAEIGNSYGKTLIIGDAPEGFRIDAQSTAFRIGPGNQSRIPNWAASIFNGVQFNIQTGYSTAIFNQDISNKQEQSGLVLHGSGDGLPIASAGDPMPLMTFPKQMTERVTFDPIRQSVIVFDSLENVQNGLAQEPMFRLGYSMLTVMDREQGKWYAYVSESDKKMLGKNMKGNWELIKEARMVEKETNGHKKSNNLKEEYVIMRPSLKELRYVNNENDD